MYQIIPVYFSKKKKKEKTLKSNNPMWTCLDCLVVSYLACARLLAREMDYLEEKAGVVLLIRRWSEIYRDFPGWVVVQ